MRFDIGCVGGYVYRLAWLALFERERGEVLMHRVLPPLPPWRRAELHNEGFGDSEGWGIQCNGGAGGGG